MSDQISMTCDNCGADVVLASGETSKKCGFCGSIVNRPTDGSTPSSASKFRTLMKNAVEAENWGEVAKYSTTILEEDPTDYEAWLYKGAAAGWESRHIDDPSKEIMNCFRNAFANTSDDDVPKVLQLLASEGTDLLLALARGSRAFAIEHGYIDVGDILQNSWQDDVMNGHINKVAGFIDAAYMLTEINRNDRVAELNPLIDSRFLKLYAFLYTEVKFEGVHFSKKNPFAITDATFSFTFDHSSELGTKWGSRVDEILEKSSNNGYSAEAMELSSVSIEDFKNPRLGDAEEAQAAGGCFVATACLGAEDALVLKNLRAFRDKTLVKSRGGRLFVDFYYVVGPFAAKLISKNAPAKNLARSLILPVEKWLTEKYKD